MEKISKTNKKITQNANSCSFIGVVTDTIKHQFNTGFTLSTQCVITISVLDAEPFQLDIILSEEVEDFVRRNINPGQVVSIKCNYVKSINSFKAYFIKRVGSLVDYYTNKQTPKIVKNAL